MTNTMRTLYALAAVMILGTVVYGQDTPKTGPGGEKKPLPITNAANQVKSLNGLQGDVTLQAGTNISITPSGNSLTIAAPNVMTGVVHDSSLVGNGTPASPLSIAPEGPVNGFHRTVLVQASDGNDFGNQPFFTVPSTHQLVIEFSSARCVLPSGQKLSDMDLTFHESPHVPSEGGWYIPLLVVAKSDVDIFVANMPMKAYVNPGVRISVNISRTETSRNAECKISATGRFIPVP